MEDNILKKAYNKVLNDSSFVKLTVFSLMPYSMLFVGYLFYQTYFFINTLKYGLHLEYLKDYINKVFSYGNDFFWPFVIVIGIGLILYFFVPPIAEGALITYLDKDKTLGNSFGKGIVKFFPMFELHGFVSFFSFIMFIVIVSRIYVFGMMDNIFVITFILIYFIIVMFLNFSVVYAKYLIILEDYSTMDAVKESIKLSLLNPKITLRYFFIYLILYARIIINVLIIIGIPLLMLFFFLKTNVLSHTYVKYIIFAVMGLMFVFTAYINGIIEAFFISLWYQVFKKLEKE